MMKKLKSTITRAFHRDPETRKRSQSGNVFFVLFGSVILLGGVGSVLTSIIGGPATGVGQITRRTMSEADLAGAAKIIASTARATLGDCDGDGKIEPLAWSDPAGKPAPAGGGLMPAGTPAPSTDKWNRPVGYCAWDHGSATVADNVSACGGSTALRLTGADIITEYSIALMSAGADGIFQTTCRPYVDANADGKADLPLVEKVSGSDDIVLAYTYGEAFAAGEGGGTTGIGPQADEACTPETAGLLRDEMGTVQVCTTDGWEEIGASLAGSGNFAPLGGAALGSSHLSNAISFSGYHGQRQASVDGGAQIEVDGVLIGPTAPIAAGQSVKLIANAANAPETVLTYTLSLGALKREWKITSRDKTPAALDVTTTPSSAATSMNVSSPSASPTYGTPVTFTVTNTGEADTDTIQAAALVTLPVPPPPTAHPYFEFYVGGGHLGDNCQGKTLGGGETCQISVRPAVRNDGSYSGRLTVTAGSASDFINLSGTASGWTCTLDGQSVVHGGSHTFFSAVMHVDCGSISQSRVCNFGELNGSASFNRAACTNSDTTPDAFGFVDAAGQSLNTIVTSAAITIVGINDSSPVTVSGAGSPEVSINGGSWTTSGTITSGQTIRVRLTSANTNNATRTATVNVGGVTDAWNVTTTASGSGCGTFSHGHCGSGPAYNQINSMHLYSTSGWSTFSHSASTYREECVSFCQTSLGSSIGCVNVAWYSGGSTDFEVFCECYNTSTPAGGSPSGWGPPRQMDGSIAASCIVPDTSPDAFTFIDAVGQALNTQITSNTVTIGGINMATSVSVSGDGSPQISINGGGWTTSGTITNGQSLRVRLTSANTNNATRNATVNVGGITDIFSVTTLAPSLPCTVGAGTAWTVSGTTCNLDSAVNIGHGANGNGSDTGAPTTGSATWSCNNGTATYQSGTCVADLGPCPQAGHGGLGYGCSCMDCHTSGAALFATPDLNLLGNKGLGGDIAPIEKHLGQFDWIMNGNPPMLDQPETRKTFKEWLHDLNTQPDGGAP